MKGGFSVKKWFWLLPVLLWTAFIWSNSLQPAEVSGQVSGTLENLVAPVLTAVGIAPEQHTFVVRKGAHFTEFALLALLWAKALSPKRRAAAPALCAVTAALDEGIQHFVPGRSCRLLDWGIDFLGAAVGIAVFAAAVWIRKKRGSKREKAEA